MKKSIKKLSQKINFWKDLKETPKPVKVFFVGVLLLVAVVAYVLPTINSRDLKANVLFSHDSAPKAYGYGYGYDETYEPFTITDTSCTISQDNKYLSIDCTKQNKNYPQELIDAHRFAFEAGLTRNNINQEDLFLYITDWELEQIFSAFIKRFIDHNLIVGSVGQEGDSFVSRANFATKLSRMLWGDKYDGTNPYYKGHLDALKKYGVFANISNPWMNETRGYVYLTLQRVVESNLYVDSFCETPESILACSLKADECPFRCRPEVCQIPETILACQLELDTCPTECRYGWGDAGEEVRDVAITKYSNFLIKSSHKAIVNIEVENIGNTEMNINKFSHYFAMFNGYGYGHEEDSNLKINYISHLKTSLKPGESSLLAIEVESKYLPFTTDSTVTIVVEYEGDQHPQNNRMILRAENGFDGFDPYDNNSLDLTPIEEMKEKVDKKKDETSYTDSEIIREAPSSSTVVESLALEETEEENIETSYTDPEIIEEAPYSSTVIDPLPLMENTEEKISKEKAASLLEMVRNIFK